MENQNTQPPTKSEPLTLDDFNNFLDKLRAMCPGDYESATSPLAKRALIAWDLFMRKGWTKEEFEQVLDRFARKHESRDWYPRTFLDHYEICFGTDDLVM